MAEGFAKLPEPPYYVVVFSSRRRGDDNDGYAEAAVRMLELVRQSPGFLGVESVRGEDGFGITTAYFDSEHAIKVWRYQSEHVAARARGRHEWYEHFEVRIARVERAYCMRSGDAHP